MKYLLMVRNPDTTAVVYWEEFDAAAHTPEEVGAWAAARMKDLQVRYPGPGYEIVSAGADSLDDLLDRYPEYRPNGWVRKKLH